MGGDRVTTMTMRALRGLAGLVFAVLAGLSAQAAEPVAANWTGRDPEAEKGPGAQVYRENCAACHDAGLNRAPQRGNLVDMTPEAIHRALTSGALQEHGTALSDEHPAVVVDQFEQLANHAGFRTRGRWAGFEIGAPKVEHVARPSRRLQTHLLGGESGQQRVGLGRVGDE